MPELPEVETIARELRPLLIDRQVASARVLWPRTVAEPAPEVFVARMAGQRFADVGRRGKYVVCALASGEALLVHLRMTGRLEVVGSGAPALTGPHLRAWLQFTDGDHLAFNDPRKFGRIWLTDDVAGVVGKLGPEPLGWEFTPELLGQRLHGRRGAMKALLLDQTVL